jgi:hypothetical protein
MRRAGFAPGPKLERKPDLGYRESMATTYDLHGLRVRSEIPLGERIAARGNHDVDVRWGVEVEIPADPPRGRLLALRDPGVGGCTIVETPTGHTIRFTDECDFRISADQRSIVVDVDPSLNREMVPVILTGNVLAAVLGLQGECVLHASGVRSDGWALAILGGAGLGKSTLAALFCAGGAELISDDLLRIVSNGDRPHCYTGTAQIRLRSKAAELATCFPPAAREPTVDGRIGVRPAQAVGPSFELDAALIPQPSRRARKLRVRRLPQKEALVALLSYPRVLGWHDSAPIRRHFEVCAEIAERVPVFEALIPWGPPFAPDVGDALIEKLRAASSGR